MGQHIDAVDTWEKTIRTARNASTEARRKAREDCEAARGELRARGDYTADEMYDPMRRREAALQAADEAMADAIDSAWKALGAAVAGDPLAEWIINNCRNNSYEAAGVIRLLPATLAELDAYAESEEWCSTWSEYRSRAIRDGVLDMPPNTGARRAVHDFVNGLCCPMDARQANAFDGLLDVMISASTAPAEQAAQ